MSSETVPLRVLVVDDDPGVRTICEFALTRLENWTTISCEGCDAALEILGRREFDLVLLDVMMPRIDGFETLRRIRAVPTTRHLPIIFLTAKVDLPDLPSDIPVVIGTIAKPFDPIELGERIRGLLGVVNKSVSREGGA